MSNLSACVEECESSDHWSGPCASELQRYLECTVEPEQACPVFADIGLSSEDAPCYEENDSYSTCLDRNETAE